MSEQCHWSERENALLASYAMYSSDSRGRRHEESLHRYRSPYQRDRDRILHSAAFRRLSGKMQVFTGDMGDYHRTRLTHTHEVATIARTLGRVLRLNEDLIEALALFHDIGHPPYGHSGEDALNDCLKDFGGFSHNSFALVLAEELENRYTPYPGMNLSLEILEGQSFRITHSGATPLLEVQIVDLADSLAYNAHDVDDALTLGLLEFSQLEQLDLVRRALQWSPPEPRNDDLTRRRKSLVHSLIDVQVADILDRSLAMLGPFQGSDHRAVCESGTLLGMSPTIATEREQLGQFLFRNVYRHPRLMEVRRQAAERVQQLYEHLTAHPELLPVRFETYASRHSTEIAVGHYLAGMTDRFCDTAFHSFIELKSSDPLDW